MSLDDKSPQTSRQLELPLSAEGEAQPQRRSEEASAATQETDAPGTSRLMERVVQRDNLLAALKRVRQNKGSCGVDGMTVEQLIPYLKDNWPRLREQLLAGTYQPQPVRQKLIPKDGGKTRMLGIPTVLDRFIQQALLQALQPIFDPTFSEHSHGFRPGRSAHDALREARQYVRDGKTWVVDVDLSKFFDRVNHDILMSRVARRVEDRRALRLIRRYLTAGISADGVVVSRHKGTPQGGPLSPLLANILLDEVDKELEARGHAFVRYADDSRVFVRSKRAGQRVMGHLRKMYSRLHLVINEDKSAVAPYTERPFLGYRMYRGQGKVDVGFCPSARSTARLKATVRRLTRRVAGRSLQQVIEELAPRLRGWRNYFRLTTGSWYLSRLDSWIRRRLRALQLKQWKTSATITRKLRGLGAKPERIRWVTRFTGRWWKAAGRPCHGALTNRYFDKLGLVRLVT